MTQDDDETGEMDEGVKMKFVTDGQASEVAHLGEGGVRSSNIAGCGAAPDRPRVS